MSATHAAPSRAPQAMNTVYDQPHHTKSAATYLGLSASILNKWRLDGRGPTFRKFGSRVIYLQSDLDAFRDAGRRVSTSALSGRQRPSL
jgi:hypothetical protein